MNWYKSLGWVGLIALSTSCDSLFLEPEIPSDQIPSETAIQTAEDAQNLLNASYHETANYLGGQYQTLAELLGDNLRINGSSGNLVQVYNRASDFFNGDVGGHYATAYRAVYRANDIINRADLDVVSDQMVAEARFLRGLAHLELVRLWAQPYGYSADNSHDGIVISNSTDYTLVSRNTVAEVYAFVEEELQFAEANLPASNGFYATSWAAKAALARMYFQMHDYANAATYATDVIENGPFTWNTTDPNERYTLSGNSYDVTMYENVFTVVSTSNIDNRSGFYRGNYNTEAAGPPFLRITNPFGAAVLADANDGRGAWLELTNEGDPNEFYGLNKFNSDVQNNGVFTLTEMYLIAAESFAEEGNTASAVANLNPVMLRAGLSGLSTGDALATIILTAQAQRRIEFMGEGHRTHDLKRLGSDGETISVRGSNWDCDGMVLQFPASEQSDNFNMNPEGGC